MGHPEGDLYAFGRFAGRSRRGQEAGEDQGAETFDMGLQGGVKLFGYGDEVVAFCGDCAGT